MLIDVLCEMLNKDVTIECGGMLIRGYFSRAEDCSQGESVLPRFLDGSTLKPILVSVRLSASLEMQITDVEIAEDATEGEKVAYLEFQRKSQT